MHESALCAPIGRCPAAATAQGRNTKAKQIQPKQIQSREKTHRERERRTQTDTDGHRMTDDQERNTDSYIKNKKAL